MIGTPKPVYRKEIRNQENRILYLLLRDVKGWFTPPVSDSIVFGCRLRGKDLPLFVLLFSCIINLTFSSLVKVPIL